MRTTLELAWRLLRGGGRRGLLGSLLTLAAVAVSTGLLLFAVGANHAFSQRADADAWRHPATMAGGAATAVQALDTDYVRGTPITIVDLAATGGSASRQAPVPPGMKAFPKPGDLWVSPALADMIKKLPADQLAKRFRAGAPTGILGDEALVHPGELVAVAGHKPADPAMTVERNDTTGSETTASPAPIDHYATGAVSTIPQVYQILAIIASVLMVVPLLVFGGAAARLTVARRDQRLAALRLVGATPGQVVAITAAEAVLTAAAGAVAGALLYAAAIPALTQITIGGGTWFAGDLWPGLLPLAAVLVAVPLLVGVSAIVGLRRVVVSPLGVAKRETPPGMKAIRLAVFGAIVVAFGMISGNLLSMGKTGAVLLVVFLALGFLSINLVGPWVVALIGRVTAGTARGPARLLAGRRLIDDPRSAWRTVAGVALTGFVAGFLSLMNPAAMPGADAKDRMELTVAKARAAAVADQARERLAGIPAKVTVGGAGSDDYSRTVEITVPGGDAAVDRARTALHGVVPGTSPTPPAGSGAELYLLADLRTGALTVLVVSFLIAITSAGITGASAVLDRRQTYAMLRLAGTPLEVLDRARRQETLIPLAVMGGGSLLTGLFFASPFAVGFGFSGALTLVAFVVLGFAGIIGAGALSRPLLRSVTADPAPRPD
ncbi:ABC transporter permease family protein [Actinomadura rudentiformis]|uniref:ABC transporter permease n=1 Tax=Actinomadura rudentiformis TaxID=359158 RepID=A0A6H9YLL9_9ACTN|nr:ABC transporter permease [Actinomadura rudentiformis]KAB2347409.1 ABC transporter permease [Actinomadura rudentiformis]